jgi:hypothetical protein
VVLSKQFDSEVCSEADIVLSFIARWPEAPVRTKSIWYRTADYEEKLLATITATPLPDWLSDMEDVFDETKVEILPEYREDLAMKVELLPGESIPKGSLYRLSIGRKRFLNRSWSGASPVEKSLVQ